MTPGVAASVGQLIEEGGARLVIVMGHSQCAAADKAVDRWGIEPALLWPAGALQGVCFCTWYATMVKL